MGVATRCGRWKKSINPCRERRKKASISLSKSPGSEVRRLVIVDGREREARARGVPAAPSPIPSIAGGDPSGQLSLGTATIAMVVPVWRQAGGEVVTKPEKTDKQMDGTCGWCGWRRKKEVIFGWCGRRLSGKGPRGRMCK